MTTIIVLFVENNKSKAGSHTILKRPEAIRISLKRLVSQPQAWYIAIFAALAYFSIEYLSENEGKIFLVAKGFTSVNAAFMITASWMGYAAGCPLMGWMSDFFSRRRPPMILAAFSASIAITTIVYGTNESMVTIAFFLLGIGASGQSVTYAIAVERFQRKDRAAALSFNNTIILLFASFNAPMLGGILDLTKTSQTVIYEDYTIAFTILVAIVCTSMIFPLFLVRETYCKSKADYTI